MRSKLCTALAVAIGLAGITAPSALANHVKTPPGIVIVKVTCPTTVGQNATVSLSVTYEAWSNQNNPVTEKTTVNGGAPMTQSYTVPGSGATHLWSATAPIAATYHVAFNATWPGGAYAGTADAAGCSTPVTPPPSGPPSTPPPPAPTCASNPPSPGATQGSWGACKTPEQVCTDQGLTGTYTGGPLGTEGCVTPTPVASTPAVVTPTTPVVAKPKPKPKVTPKRHKHHHPKAKKPKHHTPAFTG